MNNNIYLTMVNTTDYLLGVYILNRSLVDVKSKYPLVVMIPKTDNEEIIKFLNFHGIKFIEIDIDINFKTKESYYWEKTFDKLAMFGMSQFDKIVFVDCDMIVMHNIDNLFDCLNMSAVIAGKCVTGNEHWTKLNSGLIVFEPDKKVMNNLVKLVPSVINKLDRCGDQDVIQEYFSDWGKELELPQEYNFFFECINNCYLESKIKLEELKVIHFVGKFKPWQDVYKDYYKKIKLKQFIKSIFHLNFKGYNYCKKVLKRINEYLKELPKD